MLLSGLPPVSLGIYLSPSLSFSLLLPRIDPRKNWHAPNRSCIKQKPFALCRATEAVCKYVLHTGVLRSVISWARPPPYKLNKSTSVAATSRHNPCADSSMLVTHVACVLTLVNGGLSRWHWRRRWFVGRVQVHGSHSRFARRHKEAVGAYDR